MQTAKDEPAHIDGRALVPHTVGPASATTLMIPIAFLHVSCTEAAVQLARRTQRTTGTVPAASVMQATMRPPADIAACEAKGQSVASESLVNWDMQPFRLTVHQAI